MKQHIIYVVGDKYKKFASNTGSITITEAIELTNRFRVTNNTKKIYRIGQGVSVEKATELNDIIHKNNLKKYFSIANFHQIQQIESKNVVHKRKDENVMITIPELVSENHFKSYLMMDDSCAESSDHITGQHIQGMVLIEAARQMMIAVTESFYLSTKEKFYFTLDQVHTRYLGFLFPVDITLHYQVIKQSQNANGIMKSLCKIQFEQSNKVAAEIEIEFSVYKTDFINCIEELLAREAVKHALGEQDHKTTSDVLKVAHQ